MLRATRDTASSGENMTKIISIAGALSVAEPWVMAIVASMPAPCFLNEFATGTMQAEHSVISGPTVKPCNEPRKPRLPNAGPDEVGNKKVSTSPATRKAKIIPIVTRSM